MTIKKKTSPSKTLDGKNLSISEFCFLVSQANAKIAIAPSALKKVSQGRKVVEEMLKSENVYYGINTGFGRLSDVTIPKSKIAELQINLLRSHAVGVGNLLNAHEVRGMLLLRIQSLALGHSGVRPEVIQTLVQGFNRGLVPCVPEQGSCGASGDLAPLAHLAMAFIGEGEAYVWRGKNLTAPTTAAKALRNISVPPLELSAKEGLALINGTQTMTSLGALAVHRLRNLTKSADIIAAMSLEVLKGSKRPFHPKVSEVRPHPGQKEVSENFLQILKKSEILESHKNCRKLQDAYSLRCIPQVHGACRDTLAHAAGVIEIEMNSVTDNPLIFPELGEDECVISGGNFHGQPVAQVLDFLAVSATDLSSIAERRIERMLNPDLSELPAFFAHEGGVHSGYMMLQVTAASLVSESKSLCFPASADSIPTSANKEDHVSMGTTAARKLRQVIQNLESVLAIELMCAARGLEYHRPLTSSAAIEAVYAAFRKHVPTFKEDRYFAPDIREAKNFIGRGQVVALAEAEVGALK